jgi:hypothetical protein
MKIKLFLNKFKYKIKINIKIIKITFIIFILFSIVLLHFFLKINSLFSQINLKNLEIKNVKEERLTVIEKAQVQKMKELIKKCSPNYYLGFYRIEDDLKHFKTIEIIGDKKYPNLSLRMLNFNLFNKYFKIDVENLEKINGNHNFFIIENLEDYPESLEVLFLSKNNFDKIKVVVIKDSQGKPIFIHSLVRVEKFKSYKCDDRDISKLLQELIDNLIYLL